MKRSDQRFLAGLLNEPPTDQTYDGLPRIVQGGPLARRVRDGRTQVKLLIDGKHCWVDENRLSYHYPRGRGRNQ